MIMQPRQRQSSWLVKGGAMVALALGSGALTGCLTNPMQEPTQSNVPPVLVPAPETATAPAEQNNDKPEHQAPVTVTLTTDKAVYQRGQTVALTITAQNNTDAVQTLQFFSGQIFDVTASPVEQTAAKAAPVWRWSRGKMFTQDMPVRSLAAGATQSWTATWDQTANNNLPVPRSHYILQARILANKGLDAAPVSIELQD